jgi:hypothetical protein
MASRLALYAEVSQGVRREISVDVINLWLSACNRGVGYG